VKHHVFCSVLLSIFYFLKVLIWNIFFSLYFYVF